MFDSITTRTKILAGVTAVTVVATIVSAIKDHKDEKALLEIDAEPVQDVVDPLADLDK